MKKILTLLFALKLFAVPMKNDVNFVGMDISFLKTSSYKSAYSLKAGYYFIDANPFRIDNRIYIEASYVKKDYYKFDLNLDWIKRNFSIFSPYVGVNFGVVKLNKSEMSWGFNGGLIVTLNKKVDIDTSFKWIHPIKNIDNIKKGSIGINFNF